MLIRDDQGRLLGNRQRLAAELRRLRDLAGMSGRELADRIGISQSKVSRIETGRTIPTVPEVSAWASEVKASADTASLLQALTEAAFTEVHRWDPLVQGHRNVQGDVQQVEARAHTISVFEPSVVPGLLQTANYARRAIELFQPMYAEADLPAVVAGRLDRQLALFDLERKFQFLITEAALRWRLGPPGLLLAQLDRIVSLTTLENISMGLITHAAPAVTYVPHGFVLFDLQDDMSDAGKGIAGEAVVMVETVHANLTVSDPESLALYRRQWSLLERTAIVGEDARDFLSGLRAELRTVESW
ncbi:helix-turn-helix domain-containing protein [Spirillospora sp. CA-255316]